MRLSIPPNDVARFQSSTAAATAMAALSPLRMRTENIPPKPPIICRTAT